MEAPSATLCRFDLPQTENPGRWSPSDAEVAFSDAELIQRQIELFKSRGGGWHEVPTRG